MLLHRKSGQRIDLTNSVRARRTLGDLGFSCSNATPGWYYDGSVFRQAAANACRYSAEGGRTGLLVESADENILLYSSENDATWTTSNATKSATGNSIINGKTPIKVTASAAAGYLQQSSGATTTDCFYVIVEQGDSTVADIEVYDSVLGSVSRVRLTFATGAVSQISGASDYSGAYRICESGPNGGATWYLFLTATAAGTSRSVRFYPDSVSGTKYCYMHHAQLSTLQTHPSSPIVTTAAQGSRGNDVISSTTIPSWWNNSEVTIIAKAERMFYNVEQGAIFASSNAGLTDYVLCTVDGGGTNEGRITVSIGGGVVDVASLTAAPHGSVRGYAYSAKNGSTYAASNGGVSANANQVGSPAAPEGLYIGQALGALYWLEGRIYSIVIRPKALSSTELAANS